MRTPHTPRTDTVLVCVWGLGAALALAGLGTIPHDELRDTDRSPAVSGTDTGPAVGEVEETAPWHLDEVQR